MPVSDFDPVFDAAGREWNVDPNLLRAMAAQESKGDPRAVSKAGAQGLMQIMPATQRYLGVTDPNDPTQSIYGGAKYMSEALDAEKSPEDALRYYHGGKGWRDAYGPESAGYVPGVTAQYQRLTKGGAQAVPAQATKAAAVADDPFTKALNAPDTAAPAAAASDPFTRALNAPDTAAAAEPAADAQKTAGSGGIARNAAAGVLDAAGNAINIASDPAGNLVGKPLATAAVFAHDALAPYLGYERFPADVRNMLLGDNVSQSGTRLADAAGAGGVSADTTAERLVRKGVGGAGAAAAIGASNPLLMSLVGGAGAVSGDVAASYAPDWAKPAAELGGNVLGAAAAVPAGLIARGGVNALRAGVTRFANPPGMDDVPTMTVRPGDAPAGPSPGMGGPSPSAVGADVTPAAVAAMSPDEAAAYRAMANRKWLNETQQPGAADNRVLVQGVDPTLAQIEQKVTTSRELKKLRNLSPDVSEEERAVADVHNTARVDAYNAPELASHEVDYNNGLKAAKDRIETGLAEAWSKKTTADAQPIVEQINKELSGSAGDLPPVRSAMNELQDVLQKRDGSGLKDDPQQLYGARRLINWMQSKAGQRATPSYGNEDLQGMLVRVKQAVDEAIEPAAPGFRQTISDYATERQRLGVMKALQDAEPGLYGTGGSAGKMMFSKVHLLMKKIVAANEPGAALSPWQGLTEEQFGRLKNLHDDLKRAASAQDLERAYGSDTAPNFVDFAKDYGKTGGSLAVQGGANWLFGPGLGSMVVGGVRNALEPIVGHVAAGRRTRRGLEMLHPPQSKYPTRNVLDPDAAP